MTEEQVTRALDLRRAGVPVKTIAEQVGTTEAAVRAALKRRLAPSQLDDALEADRLDRLLVAVWPAAARGDLQAVDRALKIAEQRRALLEPEPTGVGGDLAAAYDASVAAAETKDVDLALVKAGRAIAERVDRAAARGDGVELTKSLYLVPHLVKILRELQATPTARLEAAIPTKPGADEQEQVPALARFRIERGGAA